ncbi:TetR/AcrR family transcriptional regulator [Frankia sp. CNm7]|uniref:TetR/AcrR family transcriptional regulator n=1 Tax=Frankia nepalensis TaxID=1836974 RepID=A0A937RTW9_9ACTN|nr:TetR/AcrR family transcriptional regulator [Frankia nepalensis]MBL7500175.1 TetR/AcrR family transcriptional regulator [Frankia nepalensis]MBL7512407.1 TetR/AcrR family transcriptional regulator [Frankia nepalensis]MBL7518531.1 TetR/AcrR family transcriptional regulator [Frankia nepalensis]MBL7632723.1 TetR/AcrR family transcriptional regulator [Frankia nepalensis]
MTGGRRRSETSRLAILDAARDLLLEGGYEQLTIDAIAGRAGVGKQTIYRWWGSKGAVVADAALEGGLAQPLTPLPDTGDIETDLRRWLRAWTEHLTTAQGTGLILALTAATADDHTVADVLFERFTQPHEQLLRDRLERARGAGQLASDAPVPTIASVLIGSLLYRVLTRQAPPTVDDADLVVRLVLGGAG